MKTARRKLAIGALALGLAGAGLGLAGNVAHADQSAPDATSTSTTTTSYAGVYQWDPTTGTLSPTGTTSSTTSSTLSQDGTNPMDLISVKGTTNVVPLTSGSFTLADSDDTVIAL